MRTNPRPTSDTISVYYPEDYAPYLAEQPSVARTHGWAKKLLIQGLGLDSKVIPAITPGRMLEVGCASGSYMGQMRQAGWAVEGIEFSEVPARTARNKGFSVEVATLEAASGPKERVDVIAAWMVLEHLHDPAGGLAKLRTWVKPGGYLVASVPDAGSIELRLFGERWYALHLPVHLYHYSRGSLAAVLRKAGWELVRVRWQRNCFNLLWSLEYLGRDKSWHRLCRAARWLRTAPAAGKLRVMLGWVLGAARQSGRMEIWAQSIPDQSPPGR